MLSELACLGLELYGSRLLADGSVRAGRATQADTKINMLLKAQAHEFSTCQAVHPSRTLDVRAQSGERGEGGWVMVVMEVRRRPVKMHRLADGHRWHA